MRKNMLTIVIVALCAMNLVLSAVLVFAVVPASNRTSKLVDQVASIINLETDAASKDLEDKVDPSNVETYKIDQNFTFNLLRSADGSDHYAVIDSITLSLNKSSKDYSKLSDTIDSNQNFITDIVQEVVASYSYDNAITSQEEMKAEILQKIQAHFNSDFIFAVSLNNLCFQ